MKQLLFLFLSVATLAHGQGYNHQWLLGYWNLNDPKGRMLVDNNSYSLLTENRKMPFWGTEANFSGSNGNLLMSSNGILMRHSKKTNAVSDIFKAQIIPNPASSTAKLVYALPDDAGGSFIIFNSVGQIVYQYNLISSENSLNFNTEKLTPGVFYYKILARGNLIDNGKLVIIK